jgi:tRNA pseudouridine55 synthase
MMSQIEGVLSIDKPAGLTSHDVVARIRLISGIRRVGHTGTLDPLATGLLILCLGQATRLAEFLAGQNKEYLATIRLGQETNTFDAEGTIVAEKPVNVSKIQLLAALDQFRGKIKQIPPMYSAVKVDGQPLYRRARQGKVIDRPAREVTIFELDLYCWQSPEIQVRLVCSSGTYVRVIAHDLGRSLGCGAYLMGLRRTAVGNHRVDTAIPLADLQKSGWQDYLQPSDIAVSHLPGVVLVEEEAVSLYHGQRVPHHSESVESLVRAYDENGRFIGILTGDEQYWSAKKILYQPGECSDKITRQ